MCYEHEPEGGGRGADGEDSSSGDAGEEMESVVAMPCADGPAAWSGGSFFTSGHNSNPSFASSSLLLLPNRSTSTR